MKYLHLIVLLFVALFAHELIGQDSLKVLTYNIEGMKPGTLPGFRLAHIIDEIKNINPDIIALQEINQALNSDGSDNQGLLIAQALSEYSGEEYHYYQQYTHLSWDNQFREYIGIITKYPLLEIGFSQLATGVFPRKVIWNYMETPLGLINFFCTHLSFNDSSVRLQQVQQIDAYVRAVEEENDAVISILCGDFNDRPDAAGIQFLTQNDLPYYDSFHELNPGNTGFTVPSNAPNARIDYVFYTMEDGISPNDSYTVMGEPFVGGYYRSDHLGVVTTFSTTIDGVEEVENKENEIFHLFPDYPNPYVLGGSFHYELFEPGRIKISLQTTTGQEYEIITDERQTRGEYYFTIPEIAKNQHFFILKVQMNNFLKYYKIASF